MNWTIVPWLLRASLITGLALLIIGIAEAIVFPFKYGPVAVLVPFLAVGALVLAFGALLPRIDAFVAQLTRDRQITPYSALAETARIQAGSLEQALPGLAEVLAGSTGARRASVWLAVEDHLVCVAEHSPVAHSTHPHRRRTPNLAVLLGDDDTDYVVPVLDGTALRAALVITKSGAGISANHKLLVRDIGRGAALLLRGEARNAELGERVRRANDCVAELRASQGRLTWARDVERRWLADELTHAAAGRTSGLHDAVAAAQRCLARQPSEREAALAALTWVGTELDEMADRIRTTGRRIYPPTLRGSGLVAALEEMVVDLPRPVQWSGDLGGRLDWEVECGIYCAAATALRILGAQPSEQELLVALERAGGRVAVRIVDPSPSVVLDTVRAGLAVEVERLGALDGGLELTGTGADEGRRTGALTLNAWLPDRLEPAVAGSPDVVARRP
jgi:hypothetical protein